MVVDKMPISFSAAGSHGIVEKDNYRQYIDETDLYFGQIKGLLECLLFAHSRKLIIIEKRAKQPLIRPCF